MSGDTPTAEDLEDTREMVRERARMAEYDWRAGYVITDVRGVEALIGSLEAEDERLRDVIDRITNLNHERGAEILALEREVARLRADAEQAEQRADQAERERDPMSGDTPTLTSEIARVVRLGYDVDALADQIDGGAGLEGVGDTLRKRGATLRLLLNERESAHRDEVARLRAEALAHEQRADQAERERDELAALVNCVELEST